MINGPSKMPDNTDWDESPAIFSDCGPKSKGYCDKKYKECDASGKCITKIARYDYNKKTINII